MSRSMKELQELQTLPLKYKVMLTEERIKEWVEEFGEGGVYVSFSGGKDSTVLLNIVRGLYQGIPAVFADTGLEYPEIREFVKTFDNVVWLKPKKNFKRVIEDYGYPFISKENAQKIYEIRHARSDTLRMNRMYRDSMGNGKLPRKYEFMLVQNAPEVSHLCCNAMKKSPVKQYEKRTGRKPLVATMAIESRNRTTVWLKNGCNAYDSKRPISNPMSFWTEQDVLLFIKEYNIRICKVYGDIAKDEKNRLTTTGCNRTGCMFCGFGCHLEKKGDGRFLKLKETHPKLYDYIMRATDKGGLGYKEVIDWINEHGNLNIEY